MLDALEEYRDLEFMAVPQERLLLPEWLSVPIRTRFHPMNARFTSRQASTANTAS